MEDLKMSICVKYRQSKSGDIEEISKLFKSCFCDFNAYGKSYVHEANDN